MNKCLKIMNYVAGGILTVAAIVILIWGFHKYVDSLVDKKVQEDATIERLAAKINPVVVFDSNNSILRGSSSMNLLIDNIKVNNKADYYEVIVTPKKMLESPPLLTCVNAQCDSVSKRGEKFEWIYKVITGIIVDAAYLNPSDSSEMIIVFKLEIIK